MSRETLLAVLSEEIGSRGEHLRFVVPGDPPGYVRFHVPERVLPLIAAIPEVQSSAGKVLNHGGFGSTLHPAALGEAVIDRALSATPEQAVADLYEFLAKDHTSSIEVCVLRGIEVGELVELLPGLYIAPLSRVPSSRLQAYVTERGSRHQSSFPMHAAQINDLRVMPGCAIYRHRVVRPKWLNPNEYPKPDQGYPLTTIASLLTLVGPSSPFAVNAYTELADGELLKGHTGTAWQSGMEETSVTKNIAVSSEELASLGSTINAFFALPQRVQQQLQVPLHRLNEAVRHQSAVDRALDLGIALESLLLSQQNSKDQLILQFRLRGAWLLGANSAHRAELSKKFRTLYELRSNAAHSGKVDTSKMGQETVDAKLTEGLEICGSAIRRVIEAGGYPDWDSLLVGAEYTVDRDAAT